LKRGTPERKSKGDEGGEILRFGRHFEKKFGERPEKFPEFNVENGTGKRSTGHQKGQKKQERMLLGNDLLHRGDEGKSGALWESIMVGKNGKPLHWDLLQGSRG